MDKTKFITYEERLELEKLKDSDFSSRDIASFLGRSSGLVKTEYVRGGGRYNYTAKKGEEEFKRREDLRKNSYKFRQFNIKSLDFETRKKIEELKDSNLSGAEIGKIINRHKNVINREFKMCEGRQFYSAEKSQKLADEIKQKKYQELSIQNAGEKRFLENTDFSSEYVANKINFSNKHHVANVPDYIPKIPFKLWIDRYKEENAPKRVYWTKEIRYFDFWVKHFGDRIAVDISPLEIEEVSNLILSKKTSKNSKALPSKETRRKYLFMLSSLFTTAIKEWKWAVFNPISAVDTRLKEKTSYKVYSNEFNELHNQLRKDFIYYIKEAKTRLLLSDRNLSKMCGISFSIMQRVMKEEHNVTLRIICKICTALGLNLTLGKKEKNES